MKAIELRAALIAANDINLNGADALIESSILKQLIESCKVRIDEIEPEAKALAEQELAEIGETSGKFEHEGHHYTLDVTEVFDIVGKPQKYTMPEGVEYRKKAAEQAEYKKASAKLTRDMKTIMDNFPGNHPSIAPDDIKTVLKCLD
jgi:L-fucose isomerase-like protein